jgi:hypothetical protein
MGEVHKPIDYECNTTSSQTFRFDMEDWFKFREISVPAGRVVPQAASRWPPTAAIHVQAQVKSCGICGAQSGTG